MKRVDHIVVGFGLAGANLERELTKRGLDVLVVDRAAPNTSSRVAAGLLTPITGKRLVPTHRWREFWPLAVAAYGDDLIEQPTIRLFASEDERTAFSKRRDEVPELIADDEPELPSRVRSPHGAFAMRESGRLDTRAFLDRRRREIGDRILDVSLSPEDFEANRDGVVLPSLDVGTDHVTLCTGFPTHRAHPLFAHVDFRPAKGEILTLRIEGFDFSGTLHAPRIWLTSLGGGVFRAGATYDWHTIDSHTTKDGREEVLSRLTAILPGPFEVLDHVAGIRPIVHGRQPVAGVHPAFPTVGYINGLGSKGAIFAPAIAQMYCDRLEGHDSIDPVFDLDRRFPVANGTR